MVTTGGAKFSQIMTGAQEIVGELAGPGVQHLAEDRMFADAKRAFSMLFTKYGWEQYIDWQSLALDGSTGLVTTTALEYVRDFHDFIFVGRDGETVAMPTLPKRLNPFALQSGSRPLYWTSLPVTHAAYLTKRIKFYPVTATGNVNVGAKIYPIKNTEEFSKDTYVHIDRSLMEYATAFMTLAFDAINPEAASVCKGLMEDRFKDIMSSLSSHPIGPSSSGIPTNDWMQV